MRRSGISIVVGGLVLMLDGCASIAPKTDTSLTFTAPPVGSGNATMTTGSPLLVDWWSRFNDLQLSNLIIEALKANTNVKSARAALLQARALRDVSAAALLPGLNASASAQRGTTGRKSMGNNFQLGLDASWEIDIFGANRDALAASEATALSGAASLSDVQASIAAEVALGYIALRGTQTRLTATAANFASQQEMLQITQWRLQAGLVTSAEADAARAPNFKLGGSFGVGATALNALTRSAAVVSSLLASVAMPLFDGGTSGAQVSAQQAAMEQARAAYKAALLNALKEVEDALSTLRGDRERSLRLRQAADAAGNAAQLARQRYSSGLVDFHVVLETQRILPMLRQSTSLCNPLVECHRVARRFLFGFRASTLVY
jgi:outer membrane protein TolC